MLHKLSRRELAAYGLLLEKGEWELGEAIDFLRYELCTTKRTARNIIKRLKKLNIIKISINNEKIMIHVVNPTRIIQETTKEYITRRQEKCYALAKITRQRDQHGQ